MKSTIRLFKALPIEKEGKKNPTKEILNETIKRGFMFSPEVTYNYSETELLALISSIEEEFGITGEKANNSFHKSWKKVSDASIEQLVIEQIIHYMTTYGFEALGIYNKESVYIPNEKLEIPELDTDGFNLIIIRGYTKPELKKKLTSFLLSGIALGDDTKRDVIDVCLFVEITTKEIEGIKNKEVRVTLYDFLDKIPEEPIEFLRYCIYKSTGNTLLIKDKSTIEAIKSKENFDTLALLYKYKNKYGLENLAQIFYRFKPIFLAFKTNSQLSQYVNKIRKLAKKHHKPMKPDFLNDVTSKIKNGEKIDKATLDQELNRVNTFRKIRLAYALKYRTGDVESILYKIRNGKGYATNFDFQQKEVAEKTYNIVLDSVIKDISRSVSGKKIYIPKFITYALPATEKQFTGDFPSGTYISVPKDMIVGIHWNDVDYNRIDLDLSLINSPTGKIGWDVAYRTDDRNVLFSGDMTSAPKPDGATELFYIKRQLPSSYIMLVNYYNFDADIEVPFKIMVAKESIGSLKENYMVNPNNIIGVSKTKISQVQSILGLLVVTENECRFYFSQTSLGMSITSSVNEFVENARKYLFDFYTNSISLNDVLEKAGAKITNDKENCDIDLSPENLDKGKIIDLVVG